LESEVSRLSVIYEEEFVRTLLEKIAIYDDYIIIEFKSGIEIQIKE
jgi:hypothetical protein